MNGRGFATLQVQIDTCSNLFFLKLTERNNSPKISKIMEPICNPLIN
jgi:hypothetical protein